MNVNIKTVTAAELIELLQELNPSDKVAFASDFGDHTHTQQVHFLKGDVREAALRQSSYSDSGWAVDEDNDCSRDVFIIS